MTDSVIYSLAERLGVLLSQRSWQLATAESCTGGRIAAAITSVAGSSAWFECGVVSYANSIKQQLLSVDASILEEQGAVSESVVVGMAAGVRELAHANLSVAVSGVAGPGGGSQDKPVGTVWFAWQSPTQIKTSRQFFLGDRNRIQSAATEFALRGLIEMLESE